MQFYPTFDADSIRLNMPACPVLLPASSWARLPRKADRALPVPRIPAQVPKLAADSGGFVASLRAKKLGLADGYSYSSDEYVIWLQALGPRLSWAGMFDYCCAGATERQVVRERQVKTTAMARLFWKRYQGMGIVFVPTVQGQTVADYRRHARELRPLIEEMARTYRQRRAWRVGIGGLVQRGAETIRQVCAAVAEELPGIPFHLWGLSLRTLRSPMVLPRQVISCDSSSWNWRYGQNLEECRASGLSVRQWVITVALPRYRANVQQDQETPQQ